MRKPSRRGTSINAARMQGWVDEFPGYRHGVSEQRIDRWIEQFKKPDRDVAARVLDAVDFIGFESINSIYRDSLTALPGWDKTKKRRAGKWRFAAYSASAGESGDAMLSKFRLANNLAGKKHDELFIYRSDILGERLGSDDTVVLIDDFAGTGTQVCEAWDMPFGELLASVGTVYLVVVCANKRAIQKIQTHTDMVVIAGYELPNSDNVFDSKCVHFVKKEKDVLLKYGKIAKRIDPKGYGECGLLLVFAHTCPNNTLPILHNSNGEWKALFRRYDT